MFWLATLLLFQTPPPVLDLPARNPHTTSADLADGKQLYQGRCAGCHGPEGSGGKGANLAVPVLPRAADDRSLYRIIRYGLPDTEMPGSLMDAREIWQTAAFVRSLGSVSAAPVAGDTRNGERVLRGKAGCLQCHALGNEGGRAGPSLTGIGARRGAAHLRAKIADPASEVHESFRMVQVTTRDGRTVRGTRLNEDSWSIQLRDAAGAFHSLWKEEIAKLVSERRTTMPPYRDRLNEQELTDLVAYLSAERGAQ
ncbi:MAG: c-type cytochrome [Bryobacteraceae bacterium]|nr:c-type cytochrome [Bryobacteraceae bacterium]